MDLHAKTQEDGIQTKAAILIDKDSHFVLETSLRDHLRTDVPLRLQERMSIIWQNRVARVNYC